MKNEYSRAGSVVSSKEGRGTGWTTRKKEKVVRHGCLPDEVIALAIDLEIACALQTIRNYELDFALKVS
eukprot:scaffold18140_cov28-Attheya_sp.AAC.1